jgi:hypothetical protein
MLKKKANENELDLVWTTIHYQHSRSGFVVSLSFFFFFKIQRVLGKPNPVNKANLKEQKTTPR